MAVNTFTRQELYDLVWSEPMRHLAKKCEVSVSRITTLCARSSIPVPARGYWGKLEAGKAPPKISLPPRGIGMSDMVTTGYGWQSQEEPDEVILNTPIPPPPVFDVELDVMRERAAAMVDKVALPQTLAQPHLLIARLLQRDDKRFQDWKNSKYRFGDPPVYFKAPFEQRRLNILNALFTVFSSIGMKPEIRGQRAREIAVIVGHHIVSFELDGVHSEEKLRREDLGYMFLERGDDEGMRLRLLSHKQSWEDKKESKLESQLRDIAIGILVSGEMIFRERKLYNYNRRIERKAELEEEQKQERAEERRRSRERKKRLERQRVSHLLAQAKSFQQANEIRSFVKSIQKGNAIASEPVAADELAQWVDWAMGEANRIDPAISGRFLMRPVEDDEAEEDEEGDEYHEDEEI